MIFYTKLAKLGKGGGVTCRQTQKGLFDVYISNGNTAKKQLTEQSKVYSLTGTLEVFGYNQVISAGNGYLIARIDNLVSMLKEE